MARYSNIWEKLIFRYMGKTCAHWFSELEDKSKLLWQQHNSPDKYQETLMAEFLIKTPMKIIVAKLFHSINVLQPMMITTTTIRVDSTVNSAEIQPSDMDVCLFVFICVCVFISHCSFSCSFSVLYLYRTDFPRCDDNAELTRNRKTWL